jgi:PAS domain S-box-containing protein
MRDSPIKSILVVDDEKEYRTLVQQFLQRLNYGCEVALDAFEALNILHKSSFDLVVSDLRMPGKDGLDLTREARQKHPHLGVVIMSGHAGEYSYSDIIAAGAADFLVKPFGMEELKAKIERIERERQVLHDLRKTNEEFEYATTYLENVFENSPDGIAVVDTHGMFTKWNKAAEEAYGYSFEELKGKSTFDLYADKAELEKMLSQLRQDGFVRKYEIEMRKKGGSIAPFEMSIGLLKDENGRMIGSIGLGRDVSDLKKALAKVEVANTQLRQEIIERKRVEETLRESERRFREILENINLLAISLDAQGRITFCNDFFMRLTGWQREELTDRDWFETCLPRESQSMMRHSYLEEIARGEITAHFEDEILTYLGKSCLIAWNNTLLRDPREWSLVRR